VPVWTELSNGFSIFSDNEHGLDSKCWFERGYEGDENGFLRVHYDLGGTETDTAYVGIFTVFTPPPCQPYSVEKYSKLRLRLRMEEANQADVRVVVSLPSSNVQRWNSEYVWPQYVIPSDKQQPVWMDVEIPFGELRPPRRVLTGRHYSFDPAQVMQFVIMVKTDANERRKGAFDIDDIRFEK
jgi:hypothetical protein